MPNHQNDKQADIKKRDEIVIAALKDVIYNIVGVSGFSSSISDNLQKSILGVNPPSYGIRLNFNENKYTIDLFLIVKYGVKIPQIAWEIQSKVKSRINRLGYITEKINIHIQGVESISEDKPNDKN